MKYVIAGTNQEAQQWIKKDMERRALTREVVYTNDYYYVSCADDLKGHQDPHGVFVGNWMGRPDIYEIVQTLIYSSIHVNKQLHDIHNSLKPKVKPTPKMQGKSAIGIIIDEYPSLLVTQAAKALADQIDQEVLKSINV